MSWQGGREAVGRHGGDGQGRRKEATGQKQEEQHKQHKQHQGEQWGRMRQLSILRKRSTFFWTTSGSDEPQRNLTANMETRDAPRSMRVESGIRQQTADRQTAARGSAAGTPITWWQQDEREAPTDLGTSKGRKRPRQHQHQHVESSRAWHTKASLQSNVNVYPASFCRLQIRGITDVRHLSLVSASWVKANFEIGIWVGGARCIGANPDAVNPALHPKGLAPGRGCPMGHGPGGFGVAVA